MNESEQLLTLDEVSAWLRRPPSTLHHWRARGLGPRSARLGRRVVYRKADVQAWVDDQFAIGQSNRGA